MYKDIEIETSYRHLTKVISKLKEPICILGGWAVFFTVKDVYQKQTGRIYIGSRDIDIGFNNVEFFKSAALILEKELNFEFISFRYYKSIHAETGKDLTKAEARSMPQHMIFPIYVDPIISYIDNNIKSKLGFTPLDEPLLKHVFINKRYRKEIKEFGKKLLLPMPQVLLATKIKSVLTREKEHKKQKDICDITALCLFGEIAINKLIKETNNLLSKSVLQKFKDMNFDQEISGCSTTLGLEQNTINSVISKIKER